MLNFKRVKQSFSVVALTTVLSTFAAGFAPALSEAAPPPRGGVRVVRHQSAPRPSLHKLRPPIMQRPSVHRPGPSPVYHRPAPRPHWSPAPPPQLRPYYDYREARHERRIARGIAAVAVLAALLGAQ